MLAEDHDDLQGTISSLVDELDDSDGLIRQKARRKLIGFGRDASPALIEVVQNDGGHARWEAIEALGEIRDPEAAPALVEALTDEEKGTCWAASNALIGLDRAAIRPLLIGLTRHFDSAQFREVAHHTLHGLKDHGRLLPEELQVLKALEGIEPAAKVPWAAQKALENLDDRS